MESGASGAITTLAKADGFVEIAENEQFVDVDQEVAVVLFRKVPKARFRFELGFISLADCSTRIPM